jgi:hypothetical protein
VGITRKSWVRLSKIDECYSLFSTSLTKSPRQEYEILFASYLRLRQLVINPVIDTYLKRQCSVTALIRRVPLCGW